MNILHYVRPGNGFVPNFPLFSRVDVAGDNKIPLYGWATSRCPPPINKFSNSMYLLYKGISAEDIRWNFEKILFDRDGQPYKRYGGETEPYQIKGDIEYLLNQPSFQKFGGQPPVNIPRPPLQRQWWYPSIYRKFWG